MKSFLSMVVIAASFSLLVPDNGAQAVNAAEGARSYSMAASHGVMGAPAVSEPSADGAPSAPASDLSWLLALGFLGAVMARRMRAD